jgi:hypothetical protein
MTELADKDDVACVESNDCRALIGAFRVSTTSNQFEWREDVHQRVALTEIMMLSVGETDRHWREPAKQKIAT